MSRCGDTRVCAERAASRVSRAFAIGFPPQNGRTGCLKTRVSLLTHREIFGHGARARAQSRRRNGRATGGAVARGRRAWIDAFVFIIISPAGKGLRTREKMILRLPALPLPPLPPPTDAPITGVECADWGLGGRIDRRLRNNASTSASRRFSLVKRGENRDLRDGEQRRGGDTTGGAKQRPPQAIINTRLPTGDAGEAREARGRGARSTLGNGGFD